MLKTAAAQGYSIIPAFRKINTVDFALPIDRIFLPFAHTGFR